MNKISAYILTKNSEKYLSSILNQLAIVADEIIIVDSGSIDETERIARSYQQVKYFFNAFENFKMQRLFAEKICTYEMVLFLDADEIPDNQFIKEIEKLKQNGFKNDAYKVTRLWNVLGKEVRCIYPITSPDHPIRMYNKKIGSFSNSQLVHEAPTGFSNVGEIKGLVNHFTFETLEELDRKLQLYTHIAAEDLILKKKKINFFTLILNPIIAFVKWYIFKQGFRDGKVGLILGKYAYNYTILKYKKAKNLK